MDLGLDRDTLDPSAGCDAGEAQDAFVVPAILRGDPASAIWKRPAADETLVAPVLQPEDVLRRRTRQRRIVGSLFLAMFLMLAAGVVTMMWQQAQDDVSARQLARRGVPPNFDPAKLSVSDPALLLKLSAEDAVAANDAIPLSHDMNPPARKLVVSLVDGGSYLRSVDCLTAAIYYEAASEPDDGMRAVAQVVLNRVRHKAYPNTVCGVVFQGSERRTGCQFSFTCDGSLNRVPSRNGWARARNFAVMALGGYVYEPLGLATHYHADYVLPVWAKSLSKVAVIGRHIFYKWGGSYGSPAAFDTLYAGNEPAVMGQALNGALALESEAAVSDLANASLVAPMARPVLDSAGRTLDGKVELSSHAAGPGAGTAGADVKPALPAAGGRWVLSMPQAAASGAAKQE